MTIRIDKCTDPLAWYANRIGHTMAVERVEINRSPSQGIPEDVYWCREGGTYNPINYVRKSDATLADDTPRTNHRFAASQKFKMMHTRLVWMTDLARSLERQSNAQANHLERMAKALRVADDCLHTLAKIKPTLVHEIYGDAEHETDAVLSEYNKTKQL